MQQIKPNMVEVNGQMVDANTSAWERAQSRYALLPDEMIEQLFVMRPAIRLALSGPLGRMEAQPPAPRKPRTKKATPATVAAAE